MHSLSEVCIDMSYTTDEIKTFFRNENRQVLRITMGVRTPQSSIAGYAIVGSAVVSDMSLIVISDMDVVSGSFVLDRAIASGTNIGVGECIASELSFTLYNDTGRFNGVDFLGAEMKVDVGVVDDDGNIAGYVGMGHFIIDTQPKIRSRIQITALDNMVKFDQYVYMNSYLSWAIGKTVSEYLNKACIECEVPLSTDISGFPNADYVVPTAPMGERLTWRNIVQYCVGIMGANAQINRYGSLEVVKPIRLMMNPQTAVVDMAIAGENNPQSSYYAIVDTDNLGAIQDADWIAETITAEDRFASSYEDYTVAVTGITYSDNEDTTHIVGTDTYAIDVTDNPMIQDLWHNLNGIASSIVNVEYTPMTAQTVPFPYLFPGSWVNYNISFGVYKLCYLTNVTFHLNGHTDITSVGESPQRNSYAKGDGMTASAKHYTEVEKTRLEKRIDLNADAIALTAEEIALKVSKDSVVNEINLSEEGIQINADKLNINGVLSANGNFKVNMDGTIEATNGIFNGTINSENANITGGSLNVTADTASEAKVSVGYGDYESRMYAAGYIVGTDSSLLTGEACQLELRPNSLILKPQSVSGVIGSYTRLTVDTSGNSHLYVDDIILPDGTLKNLATVAYTEIGTF